MQDDPLRDLRQAEIQRRAEEAGVKARDDRRGRVRLLCAQCEAFSDPKRARLEWLPSSQDELLQFERASLLDPRDDRWPDVNRRFATAWLELWIILCTEIVALADDAVVSGLEPSDSRLGEMHKLSRRLLKQEPQEAVVRDLAALRAILEPTLDERTGHGLVKIGDRYELRSYFPWLRSELARLWAAPAKPVHAFLPVLTELQQRFRDLLLERAPTDAITSPSLCDLYHRRFNEAIADSDFRTRVVPALRAHGLKSEGKKGYFFPENASARRRLS